MAPRKSLPSDVLSKALKVEPHVFLQPTQKLHNAALAHLKDTLDPLANTLHHRQTQRHAQITRKRKRGEPARSDMGPEPLRLKQVHVDGFEVEQVWDQVRRILDAVKREADDAVAKLGLDAGEHVPGEEQTPALDENGTSSEESADEGDATDSEELDATLAEEQDFEIDVAEEEPASDNEDIEIDDELDSEADVMGSEVEDESTADVPQEYEPDANGLNDGFFSLDDFNRQSTMLEQADMRGDRADGSDSEDEIDFTADPTVGGSSLQKSSSTTKKVNKQSAKDDSDDEGATFGDMDLDAPEGASDDESASDGDDDEEASDVDTMGLANTNSVMYQDFFAPPAQKARKNKRGRPNPHNFPQPETLLKSEAANDNDEDDDDVEKTMSAVHRDLFEDESEADDEPRTADADLDPTDPRSRKSTHERRRAALAEEIRRLEAANVAKRDWTLSGEARAADRPVNSLLEEDLEFERTGKPVPVVTAELGETITDLIKRRILAHDFQDLIRRRPDDLATRNDGSTRRTFELDDTKSKAGLADLYEQDHLKATDANYIDATDEKTRVAQLEITNMWKDLVGKLDSLSSWHFRPRQPVAAMDITRIDAPAVQIEDARPSAGADAAGASMLAPQEIYKGGSAIDRSAGETITRGGVPLAKEEMSREDKTRRRRRDKERSAKRKEMSASNSNVQGTDRGSGKNATEGKSARASEKQVIGQLQKGGVRVIGKKGEIRDVQGNAVRTSAAPGIGAANLKL